MEKFNWNVQRSLWADTWLGPERSAGSSGLEGGFPKRYRISQVHTILFCLDTYMRVCVGIQLKEQGSLRQREKRELLVWNSKRVTLSIPDHGACDWWELRQLLAQHTMTFGVLTIWKSVMIRYENSTKCIIIHQIWKEYVSLCICLLSLWAALSTLTPLLRVKDFKMKQKWTLP